MFSWFCLHRAEPVEVGEGKVGRERKRERRREGESLEAGSLSCLFLQGHYCNHGGYTLMTGTCQKLYLHIPSHLEWKFQQINFRETQTFCPLQQVRLNIFFYIYLRAICLSYSVNCPCPFIIFWLGCFERLKNKPKNENLLTSYVRWKPPGIETHLDMIDHPLWLLRRK